MPGQIAKYPSSRDSFEPYTKEEVGELVILAAGPSANASRMDSRVETTRREEETHQTVRDKGSVLQAIISATETAVEAKLYTWIPKKPGYCFAASLRVTVYWRIRALFFVCILHLQPTSTRSRVLPTNTLSALPTQWPKENQVSASSCLVLSFEISVPFKKDSSNEIEYSSTIRWKRSDLGFCCLQCGLIYCRLTYNWLHAKSFGAVMQFHLGLDLDRAQQQALVTIAL